MFAGTKLGDTEYAVVNLDGAFVGSKENPRPVLFEAGRGLYAGYDGHDNSHEMPMRQKILLALAQQAQTVFILTISPYTGIAFEARSLEESHSHCMPNQSRFIIGDFASLVEKLERGDLTATNTLVVVDRAGANHQLEEPEVKSMLQQRGFSDVPVLNEQDAFKMIFEKVGFAHLLSANPELTPKTWVVNQDNYVAMLAEIQALGLSSVVIKPSNSCRAKGITILTIAELKLALRWILFGEEPTVGASDYQKGKIQEFKATLSPPFEQPRCIVQEVMQPLPVKVESEAFLSAFRIVVLFTLDKETGKLTLSLIEGYLKLAREPYAGKITDATLISDHAIPPEGDFVGENFTRMSFASPGEMERIAQQRLGLPMPQGRKTLIERQVLLPLSESLARFFVMRPLAFMLDLEASNIQGLVRYFEGLEYRHFRSVDQGLIDYVKKNPVARGAAFALANVLYALQKCILANSLDFISEQHFVWLRQLLLSFDTSVDDFWNNVAVASYKIHQLLEENAKLFAPLPQWKAKIDFLVLAKMYVQKSEVPLLALSRGMQVLTLKAPASVAPLPTASVPVTIALVIQQAGDKCQRGTDVLKEKRYVEALPLLQAAQQDYLNAKHYKQVLVTATSNLAACLRDMGELKQAVKVIDDLTKLLDREGIKTLGLSSLDTKKKGCVEKQTTLASITTEDKVIRRDFSNRAAKSKATDIVARMQALTARYQAWLPYAKQTLLCFETLAVMATVTKQDDLAKASYTTAIDIATALHGADSDKVQNLKEKRAAFDDAKLNYRNMFA